jgi:hypothetical protein
MGISIEETNPNHWQDAAQSMMSAGIGSLSGNVMDPPQNLNIDPEASEWNYNKAQINMNEPGAHWSLGESHRMDQERGQQNWFQDAVPLSHDTWLVNSFNREQPIMNTGIPADNQGYKVWNAGGPFASSPFEGDYALPGIQWLEHKLFGDPDDKQGPPVDNEGNLLPGWELHQDGWHYFPPNEEEGGGWLSNPLEDLEDLRRRRREDFRRRRREDLRRRHRNPLNDLLFKRRVEDTLKFQMDMLMNPNKFNTSPGTGDINPIFGDQYWNI